MSSLALVTTRSGCSDTPQQYAQHAQETLKTVREPTCYQTMLTWAWCHRMCKADSRWSSSVTRMLNVWSFWETGGSSSSGVQNRISSIGYWSFEKVLLGACMYGLICQLPCASTGGCTSFFCIFFLLASLTVPSTCIETAKCCHSQRINLV